MQSFTISQEQIARIIGAASADELSRRFNRHFDFLTIASWSAETPLQRGGIGMSGEEMAVCARRMASVFGFAPALLQARGATTIADWAVALADAARQGLTSFAFKAATRNNADAERRHG
ncbi:MAG: hypothetical protein ACX939_12200, partial [Hyphococcus sp.]